MQTTARNKYLNIKKKKKTTKNVDDSFAVI